MPTEEVPFEISEAPKVESKIAPEDEKIPEAPVTKVEEIPVEEVPVPVQEEMPLDKVPTIELPKPDEGIKHILLFIQAGQFSLGVWSLGRK